jgi:hypothetical protein
LAKREELNKSKGIASSSNQKCEVYRTFNIIFIGLEPQPPETPPPETAPPETPPPGTAPPETAPPETAPPETPPPQETTPEPIPPGPTRSCFTCAGEECRDPYSGRDEHEIYCRPGVNHCLKVKFDNGEFLHKRHLNIYIWQSQTFSQNIQGVSRLQGITAGGDFLGLL